MNHKYTCILLDWDGCLAQTLNIWLQAYQEVFARFKLHPSSEEIVSQVFGDWNGAKKLGVDDVNQFNQHLLNTVNQKLPLVELYPDVLSTLTKLKQLPVKLVIVTSSKRESVEPAIKKNGLNQLIDLVLTKEDVVEHKPNPEIIYTAMKKTRSQLESVLIIGDSNKDVLAGKNAGIDTAIFYPKENQAFYPKQTLLDLQPDYFITHFSQLLDLVHQ